MAHAIQISRHHLAKAHKIAQSAQNRLKKVSQHAERAFDIGMDSALAAGTGAALGLLHGRHGPVEVMGVPVEMGGGLALIALGVLGVGGKHAGKLAAIGTGGVTVWGYNSAKGAGVNLKSKANKKDETTQGALPSQSLSDEELATMRKPAMAQR